MTLPARCDVFVVGAGVAGLSAAYSAARTGASVLVYSEVPVLEAHSAHGVGMNGLASRRFDWREHAAETLKGSDFSADPDIVAIMCRDAETAILELVGLGAPFDFDRIGSFGAFTFHTPSLTGSTIRTALRDALSRYPSCTVVENARVTGLLVDRATAAITGGIVRRARTDIVVESRTTVLATGGCGAVFEPTTNARWSTGEGLALAYLAGAELADLDMTQFHPTALPDGSLDGGERVVHLQGQDARGSVDDRPEHQEAAIPRPARPISPQHPVARPIPPAVP